MSFESALHKVIDHLHIHPDEKNELHQEAAETAVKAADPDEPVNTFGTETHPDA